MIHSAASQCAPLCCRVSPVSTALRPKLVKASPVSPLTCLDLVKANLDVSSANCWLHLRSMGCLPAVRRIYPLAGRRSFQMMPEKDEALGESCFQGLWRYNGSIVARVNPCTGFPLPLPQLVRSGRRGSRTPSSWRRCRRHALGRGRS